jgi:TorA maturation chaperone TorD
MTHQEKVSFSHLLASLLYPPDQELMMQIHQGALYSYFQKYFKSWGENPDLLKGFLIEGDPEVLLKELTEAYELHFSGLRGENISLVESYYKPWTLDPHCPLSFASSKGLCMGDSAIHLLEIYRLCDIQVAKDFESCPDHLAVELEFLSYLYRWATDVEIKKFIEDHLDWIPLLKEEFKQGYPHPFYRSVLEVLDLFVNRERNRLEVEDHGRKDID